MAHEKIARLLDQEGMTLQELAVSCRVSEEWVIERVEAGVLLSDPPPEPRRWIFTSHDLLRTRRLSGLEHDFDANPELAGLVADLQDELEALRARLRRVGIFNR